MKILADNPRDLALFTVVINTNLRSSDLLNLKAGQVRNLKPLDDIEIREQKTGKVRRITLNKTCTDVIEKLLASQLYEDDDPLFRGRGNNSLTALASIVL